MIWAIVVLAALVLLPGVVVVRAPWTAVPAMSLAFWTLSLWWPPLAGLSRGRVVTAALFVFALLTLLRLLPKHELPPPPGWQALPQPEPLPRPGLPPPCLASRPSLAVIVVSLALLTPALRFWHAPGPGLAFQTTCARLLLWRDGVPLSAEPLLPLEPFGAHAPAIAGLAADLARLSGIDPARAVLLVFVSAIGLTLIGLFALEATWLPPVTAAVSCLSGAVVLGSPSGFTLWGVGDAFLCLAFLLPAAALLLGHASRSSAIAAGMMLAAGLLAQPLLALAAWTTASLIDVLGRRPSAARARRAALACAAAALLGGPGVGPALRVASFRELRAILASSTWREAAAFLLLLAMLALAAALAGRLTGAGPTRGRAALLAASLGAALLVTLVHVRIGGAQLPAERRKTLSTLAETTSALDVICAPADARDWVPALAGRAVGEPGPWIPPVYRDEWASRSPESCGDGPVTSFHVVPRNHLLGWTY